MSLVQEIADRISASVAALAGRVEFAADLAALVDAGVRPQHEVAAYVVPLGFDSNGGESITGAHTQMLQKAVGVILVVSVPGDAEARAAVPKIDELEQAVIHAIAGWAPDDVAGVFGVSRGRLVSAVAGLVIYQIDFAVFDQLRVM